MNASVKTFALACVAAAILCSCGASNDKVSFQSGGLTQTFSDGAVAQKDFPLPVYPNAKPAGSVAATGDGDDDSNFMMLSSNDPVEKISNFYVDKLKSAGWSVNETSLDPKMTKLDAHKQGLEASVMVSGEDKETSISLAVSKETTGAPKLTGQQFTPDKLNPPTD